MPPAPRRALFALLLLGRACADPPALSAQGHFEVAGKKVPVAEVLARLDTDGDGGLSRSELQEGSWSWLVEEVAAGLASGPAAAERGLARLFDRLDGDASSSLDAGELAAAAAAQGGGRGPSVEERQRQMLRARATASAPAAAARRLDKAKELVDDMRCHAPKGYPTAPEGWVCVDASSPIYCTGKKRAFDVEPCAWAGECEAGQWLQGGCRYPLCKAGHDPCYNGTHELVCQSRQAHGRQETASTLRQVCSGRSSSCRYFDDGIPPSRRRRTTNCHEECHKRHCHQVCHEDPPDPPIVTCVREGCNLLEDAEKAYVRQCVTVPGDNAYE